MNFLNNKQSTFKRTPSVLSYSSPSNILRRPTANNNNGSIKEFNQSVNAVQLEAHLKDFLHKTMQGDIDQSAVKKGPSSEYKFPIKPNPLVSNMKHGPKTQNGSQHDQENIENEMEPSRDDLITSIVKNSITGDIEDINKDCFTSKAAIVTESGDNRLQR